MKLKDLLQGITVLETNADMEVDIEAVAYDSRKVTEGSLFVAISGFASDGNRFIPMAMEKARRWWSPRRSLRWMFPMCW